MDIVVTGSIAYDYLMRFPGRFADQILPEQLHKLSVSFLVDEMTKHWGGVAANISYTMALLGMKPRLMGTVGRDFPDYRAWLDAAGVDTSTVRQLDTVFTASFFANTDDDLNQIAFFYQGAMAFARDYPLAEAVDSKPDMVIISPNDPQAMTNLTEECRQGDIRFVYDISQQLARISGDELKRDMAGAYALIVNSYEAEMILNKTGMQFDELREAVDLLVITEGKDGSKIYKDGSIIEVATAPPEAVADPTGAGDAYRAGFITGIAKGLPLKIAGEMGALCATYSVEKVGTQNHLFTLDAFIERYRRYFNDDGQLDQLRV